MTLKPLYPYLRRLRGIVPKSVTGLVRTLIPVTDYDQYSRAQLDPYQGTARLWVVPESDYRLGIFEDRFHHHKHYIQACREMGVSYQLIDIFAPNWLDEVRSLQCDGFLVWPSAELSIWKDMYDERVRILERDLGMLVYPTAQEVWLYESKRRVNYWLQAHNIPHPRTWIFYDRAEALRFSDKADLPLVMKTNTGACASGVFILHDRTQLKKMVRKAFRRGVAAHRHDPRDRHWGYVYLQQYIPDVNEWRLVRIGNSYFGHRKGQHKGLHSGSGRVEWSVPERRHLDFLREVTETGGFTSMDVDVFETPEGTLLVNELQTVFGASVSIDQLRINNQPGRFVYSLTADSWEFEPGDYARNACANARVDYLISQLRRAQEQ
jgi:hypothetical protein